MPADAAPVATPGVDEPAQAPTGDPQPPAPEKPIAAAGRSVHKVYKAIAAAVGLLSSIVGLVFLFAPDLRPSGDPPTQSADLSDLRVDDDATFGQYLARIDQSPSDYSARQLERRGALLDFRVRIEGFKDRTLLLKWELFDEATGEQQNESKAITIRPTNATNEARWQFWIPMPNDAAAYSAVVELIEQKKTHRLHLASIQTTEPLPGLRRRAS